MVVEKKKRALAYSGREERSLPDVSATKIYLKGITFQKALR
jgi:hypothetical protein